MVTTFITGATSSIGRVLVKEWAQAGEPLRVLARGSSNRAGLELPGVEFVTGDVTDPEAVRRGMTGCERVVHMAAIVGYRVPEAEWWRVNRDGSRNVLQAAFDSGVRRMVQVSTLAVLGSTPPGEEGDESQLPDPSGYVTLYQKTKRAADDIAREFAAKGLAVSILYPGFGYGCSWASSHPSMAEMTLLRLAAGKPVAILGSDKNKLCLAYYKDTVQGIRLALERGRPGEGYLMGGENLTFPEIWRVIAEILGKPPPRVRVPLGLLRFVIAVTNALGKSPFPEDFVDMLSFAWNYSTAKARRELGWKPHTFREGMAETWAEYQAAGWNKT